ncbi:hypothetical protein ACWEJP_03310 [Streptomyces sp. NPDC004749]
MSHGVPALGIALLCGAGCVWYVPAVADLRAGADRPVSRRLGAAAVLTGWGTAALAVPLLLLATARGTAVLAAAGALATLALAVCSAVRRRNEQREAADRWALLRRERGPCGATEAAAGRPDDGRRAERAFLAWLVPGLALAPCAGVAVLVTGGALTPQRIAVAAGAATVVEALFLTTAAIRAGAAAR